MATSGTYVSEIPLNGSAEKHYKMWKHEGHLFSEAIGDHMIHGVAMHDGDWHTHGAIRSWDYTCDGKKEVFRERREFDDEKMAVKQIFIPTSEEGCVCKITMVWEKINDDFPEPTNYMKFVKNMVTGVDDHMAKGKNSA
ncbi:hypothetical protein AALP_AAs59458U000100 [Arabis alpina]|uniref:Bet v I/Major latex protein domain-containing protein n=1 Tax=Arabis alpina TaxID=50452 RepID=A0A087FYV3_ARAAL|nr:hypothetical protein AALP_AAs59458U000100 [Arabis alpina]